MQEKFEGISERNRYFTLGISAEQCDQHYVTKSLYRRLNSRVDTHIGVWSVEEQPQTFFWSHIYKVLWGRRVREVLSYINLLPAHYGLSSLISLWKHKTAHASPFYFSWNQRKPNWNSGKQTPLLTFLENSEVWRVLDLRPLPEPADLQRGRSSHSAFQYYHLALRGCGVLEFLKFKKQVTLSDFTPPWTTSQ